MFVLPCATQQEPRNRFQIPPASSKKMDEKRWPAPSLVLCKSLLVTCLLQEPREFAVPTSTQLCICPSLASATAHVSDREIKFRWEPEGRSGGKQALQGQGTWGQRLAVPGPPQVSCQPGDTDGLCLVTSGQGWPCGFAQTLAWQSLSPVPKSSSSAPALTFCSWLGGYSLSLGNLRPWGCMWCYFSHFVTTCNFLGKAHKLR